jgi:hypothetical protein
MPTRTESPAAKLPIPPTVTVPDEALEMLTEEPLTVAP